MTATLTDRPVEIFASGLNGALHRLPKVRDVPVPLLDAAPVVAPHWRPGWQRVKTISLTFPAGLEFLPPSQPKEGGPPPHVSETAPVELPTPCVASGGEAPPHRCPTRVKPPAEAISIEDRLFYLLQ